MLDPIRLVTDLFKEKNLSDAKLQAFANEFLIRLVLPANNPGGKYNQLLLQTTTLYQNYYGTINNQLTQDAVGKGTTVAMNEALEAVISKLRSLQGLAKYKFGEESSIYHELYPQGMTEYHHARLGDYSILLSRYRALATMHLSADYPDEITELNALIQTFFDARETQERVYAEVDAIATNRHKHRKALTLQLTRAFLIIASDHLENPDKFNDYYNPAELPIRKAKKKKKAETQQAQ